ncbi:MAG TPA: hypothetical protein PKL65_13020 [Bacteroidales bacterium]|nr:hypothetical protein [Bacteroidales bacterium]
MSGLSIMGMKQGQSFVILLIFTLIVLLPDNLPAQSNQKKSLRESAIEKFNAGNYEQAYREFSILTATYSRDPLYKYYSARCLIQLKREFAKAESLIQEAVSDPQDIKSVPADAWFYLGRVQQMSGKFQEAVRSYDHFADAAGRKKAREMKVAEFRDEAKAGKGQVQESEILFADSFANSFDVSQEITSGKEKPTDAGNKPGREALPEEYDRILSEGLMYQVKADSLNRLSALRRDEFGSLPESLRPQAKIKIDELESEAAGYQKLADERFRNSGSGHDLKKEQDPVISDTVKPIVTQIDQPVNPAEKMEETANTRGNETDRPGRIAVLSEFEIISDPAVIARQKILIDPEPSPGLIYRIQLAVFSKPVNPSVFKGISPVIGLTVPGSAAIKYYAGLFRKSADANKALIQVKQAGFRDSFLNAVLDGKIVSIDRAALLEREWGDKPLYEVQVPVKKDKEETGPPTLSYRVEVVRSVKPLKDDVVEGFRKLSAGRGLEILSGPDGSFVYLIGKFITFESASDYAGLLVRNGYREAKVAAYLGNKEIPIETAKQLFEKIK